MNKLIYKDLRLSVHPSTIIYFIVSALMLFIPDYPRWVGFLYLLIGINVMFQTDLQYKDREFCSILPVTKADCVKARVLSVMILQLGLFVFTVPFAIISSNIMINNGMHNLAGMDTNLTMYASVLISYGVTNMILIPAGFRKRFQVRVQFIVGMLVYAAINGAAEILVSGSIEQLAFLRGNSAEELKMQIPVLAVAFVLYIGMCWIAGRSGIAAYKNADI